MTSTEVRITPAIEAFVDDDTFVELHTRWAPNIVVGLGRLLASRPALTSRSPR